MIFNRFVATATRIIVFSMACSAGAFLESAAAGEGDDITLTVSSTTAQPGESIEVTLSMATPGVSPASMIVFLAFDPTALIPRTNEYEFIVSNPATGEPVLDEDGNTSTFRRAVRPSQAVTDAGKVIDSEVYLTEGVVGVSVTGLSASELPDGILFTYAFQVADDLPNGSTTEILGITDEDSIVVTSQGGTATAVSTSASSAAGLALSYSFVDSEVQVGCTAAPIPTNVTATQDRSDGVLVGWTGVGTPGAEYRVFRSTTNNPSSALPLGSTWQTATTFNDITALAPAVIQGDGCTVPDQVGTVHYFYWVRSRTIDGCQSGLTTNSAEGFRVQSTSRAAQASLLPLPSAFSASLIFGLAFLVMGWHGRRLARQSVSLKG